MCFYRLGRLTGIYYFKDTAMDEGDDQKMETLLPDYFLGRLNNEKKKQVEDWRDISEENAVLFKEYSRVWESIGLLKEMEQIDSSAALQKVNREILNKKSNERFISFLRRIAAVLILPLALYSLFATARLLNDRKENNSSLAWQTFQTQSGMHGIIDLPDGSRVTLNTNSTLQYPADFSGRIREVKLTGEAFFEVKKDAKHPFIVRMDAVNVEVLGTSFNAINYHNNESQEVVLVSGSVRLFEGSPDSRMSIGMLKPGQRAVYNKTRKVISINNTEVDKHTAWKDGYLIFREDPMQEVAKKLERWFNVEIEIQDQDIFTYPITARFHDETLNQVLTLLKLSSNIEYTIIENQKLNNGEFTKTKIYVKKKKR